ncbi:hypothetical protein QTA56_12760 [Acinetobacter sp. VNH17]|uniref:HTH luxR-type domain-containing protein n=1 Tax=Acinetobacter thutiue TaxID=2998078 RepID=A0ABT7WQZ6_9GAMM|nr:hypothetical protein [Acinetobacter thutiue]MCY6412989.1 hypothetical protein [Acinetobacter thutiue]MDN0015097.1 hypothetical protein [Acinetobacter thutiue]
MSLQQLLEVNHQLIQAVYDHRQWDQAMTSLNTLFNSCGVNFAFNFVAVSGLCDPYYKQLYHNELWQHDMLSGHMLTAPVGSIKTDEMIVSKQELQRSVLFNEWLAPQDSHSVLQIKPFQQGETSSIFTLARGGRQSKFMSSDLAMVEALLPTLQNVSAIYQRLGQVKLEQYSQGLDSLQTGFIIVDQHAQLLYQNPFAERLIHHINSPLWVKNKKLEAQQSIGHVQLKQAIFNIAQSGSLSAGQEILLPIAHEPLNLLSVFISVLPDAQSFGISCVQAVSLLIRKVGFDYGCETKQRLISLFGLSPQEAVITTYLLRGYALSEAAELENISITTARTYLNRIFRKTQTNQQSQLLALLAQILH